MAEQRETSSAVVWLGVALAFGLSFGLGRWASAKSTSSERAGGSTSAEADATPLHDGRRYKVPVSISQPKRGDDQPLVTIVEWCDLSGKACQDSEQATAHLLFDLSLRVRHTFRHLPNRGSKDSMFAHELARIAFERGKFWELRKQLLARPAGAPLTDGDADAIAQKVQLDVNALHADLREHRYTTYLFSDLRFADKFGVKQGPTYYVNGRRLAAPVTAERLERLVRAEADYAKQILARGVAQEQLYEEITRAGLFEPPLAIAKSP
jgi:protein-disulfide isomerase